MIFHGGHYEEYNLLGYKAVKSVDSKVCNFLLSCFPRGGPTRETPDILRNLLMRKYCGTILGYNTNHQFPSFIIMLIKFNCC
jgi:hypothetical protein